MGRQELSDRDTSFHLITATAVSGSFGLRNPVDMLLPGLKGDTGPFSTFPRLHTPFPNPYLILKAYFLYYNQQNLTTREQSLIHELVNSPSRY